MIPSGTTHRGGRRRLQQVRTLQTHRPRKASQKTAHIGFKGRMKLQNGGEEGRKEGGEGGKEGGKEGLRGGGREEGDTFLRV